MAKRSWLNRLRNTLSNTFKDATSSKSPVSAAVGLSVGAVAGGVTVGVLTAGVGAVPGAMAGGAIGFFAGPVIMEGVKAMFNGLKSFLGFSKSKTSEAPAPEETTNQSRQVNTIGKKLDDIQAGVNIDQIITDHEKTLKSIPSELRSTSPESQTFSSDVNHATRAVTNPATRTNRSRTVYEPITANEAKGQIQEQTQGPQAQTDVTHSSASKAQIFARTHHTDSKVNYEQVLKDYDEFIGKQGATRTAVAPTSTASTVDLNTLNKEFDDFLRHEHPELIQEAQADSSAAQASALNTAGTASHPQEDSGPAVTDPATRTNRSGTLYGSSMPAEPPASTRVMNATNTSRGASARADDDATHEAQQEGPTPSSEDEGTIFKK